MKKKVLFITYEFNDIVSGGIARVIEGITSNILTFEVDVALLYWNSEINSFSIRLYDLAGRCETRYEKDYLVIFEELIKYGFYQIVHIFHSSKFTFEIANRSKELGNVEVIYSVHSIAKLDVDIKNLMDEEIHHETNIIGCVSNLHVLNNFSKRNLLNLYPDLKNKNIFIIPNGIEELEIADSDKNIDVVCVSRWAPGKGLEFLLKAIPLVLAEFPNCKFHIVGRKSESWESGREEYLEYIEELISRINPENLKVSGWMLKNEVLDLYNKARIAIIPSEMEYFPYSILEPISCGIPIICSNLESIAELLTQKEYLKFETKDYVELSKKIIYFFNNMEVEIDKSQKIKEILQRDFSWKKIIPMYEEMYRSICKTNSSS